MTVCCVYVSVFDIGYIKKKRERTQNGDVMLKYICIQCVTLSVWIWVDACWCHINVFFKYCATLVLIVFNWLSSQFIARSDCSWTSLCFLFFSGFSKASHCPAWAVQMSNKSQSFTRQPTSYISFSFFYIISKHWFIPPPFVR